MANAHITMNSGEIMADLLISVRLKKHNARQEIPCCSQAKPIKSGLWQNSNALVAKQKTGLERVINYNRISINQIWHKKHPNLGFHHNSIKIYSTIEFSFVIDITLL